MNMQFLNNFTRNAFSLESNNTAATSLNNEALRT